MVQSFEEYEIKPRIHVVEYVRLRSVFQTFFFMSLSMRIYKYARDLQGYYAGGIRAKWWHRQFYTYTVWEDREAMLEFVQANPHAEAIRRVGEFCAPGSCYVEFVSDAPPDWDMAKERLSFPTRYFSSPGLGDLRG